MPAIGVKGRAFQSITKQDNDIASHINNIIIHIKT